MSHLSAKTVAVVQQNAVPYSRPPTPSDHALKIGFVGIGAMGTFMARNLARSKRSHPAGSPPVLIYNRTRSKCERLVKETGEDKIQIAESAAQVAKECDVIITNLANDDVVRGFYIQFAEAIKQTPPTRKKIFVETSTIYPRLAAELDSIISSIPHVRFVTAPVFGAPPVADKGQLIIVMSGDYRSKKEIAYMFVPAIGRKVIDLGGNIEKAPTFLLIGNSMIMGFIETMAESFTLADKSGIGSTAANELLQELFPDGPLAAYANKIVSDDFDGAKGFSIDGGIKDAAHIRALTTQHNSPMPLIDAAHTHMLTARALHHSRLRANEAKTETIDWSAMVAGSRVGAGLPGFDSSANYKRVQVEK